MRVLVGLGNPGHEYSLTRHNIGFMLADLLLAASPNCTDERRLLDAANALLSGKHSESNAWKEREGSLVTEISLGSRPLWLIKPQRYMNRSGEPLARFLSFYKIELDQILVAHDEIDLPVGSLRLKPGGGDGGHNGLRSIRQSMGSGEYTRVRLGVGRPPGSQGNDGQVVNWVLGRFSKEESGTVAALLVRGCLAVNSIIEHGITKAQNLYNR